MKKLLSTLFFAAALASLPLPAYAQDPGAPTQAECLQGGGTWDSAGQTCAYPLGQGDTGQNQVAIDDCDETGGTWDQETESCYYDSDDASEDGILLAPEAGQGGTGSSGVSARGINTGYLQYYKDTILWVINTLLLPLIIAAAFIVFIWGVFKKYIWSHGDPGEVSEGHKLIVWGIVGFVVIFSIWGIVRITQATLGLREGGSAPPVPTINVGR